MRIFCPGFLGACVTLILLPVITCHHIHWYNPLSCCCWHRVTYLHVFHVKRRATPHMEGSVQDCSTSIANTLELAQSCPKPPILLLSYRHNGISYTAKMASLYQNSPAGASYWESFCELKVWFMFCCCHWNTLCNIMVITEDIVQYFYDSNMFWAVYVPLIPQIFVQARVWLKIKSYHNALHDKVGIMTTLGFEWICFTEHTHTHTFCGYIVGSYWIH